MQVCVHGKPLRDSPAFESLPHSDRQTVHYQETVPSSAIGQHNSHAELEAFIVVVSYF